jgi:hypothetical protein
MNPQASRNGPSESTIGAKEKLNEQKAARLGWQFVERQGYTDVPATVDSVDVVYEFDEPANRVEALALRSGTLLAEPYQVKRLIDSPGWLVVFKYNPNSRLKTFTRDFDRYIREYGRAVTMNEDGTGIHVVHQDVKLLPN